LNVSGCSRLTDLSLAAISNLTELRSLDLSHCRKFTNAGMLQIAARCSAIVELNISATDIGDDGIAALAKCPNMEYLNVASCDISDDAMLAIIGQNIKSLHLDHCIGISNVSLESLVKLPSLVSLHVDFCREITDEGLQFLEKSTTLQSVGLSYLPNISDRAVLSLATKLAGTLQYLHINGCAKTTPKGRVKIKAALSGLRHLSSDDDILTPLDLSDTKFIHATAPFLMTNLVAWVNADFTANYVKEGEQVSQIDSLVNGLKFVRHVDAREGYRYTCPVIKRHSVKGKNFNTFMWKGTDRMGVVIQEPLFENDTTLFIVKAAVMPTINNAGVFGGTGWSYYEAGYERVYLFKWIVQASGPWTADYITLPAGNSENLQMITCTRNNNQMAITHNNLPFKTMGGTAGPVVFKGPQTVYLGNDPAGGLDEALNAKPMMVAEILLFAEALSPQRIHQVWLYLNSKYGIFDK